MIKNLLARVLGKYVTGNSDITDTLSVIGRQISTTASTNPNLQGLVGVLEEIAGVSLKSTSMVDIDNPEATRRELKVIQDQLNSLSSRRDVLQRILVAIDNKLDV
jgi:hypothetical protein